MKRAWYGIGSFTLLLAFWVAPWHLWAQGTSHSNDLTWNASTTTGVTSYKVYRGTTNGGPYTLAATVPAATTAYSDSNVSQGTTHFYVVTALVGANESIFSGQVSAVDAGTNVNPPTGLAVTSH